VQVFASAGAAPEVIQVRGGFAEVNEKGLTVLAEHVRADTFSHSTNNQQGRAGGSPFLFVSPPFAGLSGHK
jgi:F0F1-type ATP synthase, epsilon subunit (mitochondrial delta subunit)